MEIVLTCTQCVGRCPLTVWKESSNSGICILTVTSPHEQWRKVGPPLLITIYLTSVSALYNLQLELQSVQAAERIVTCLKAIRRITHFGAMHKRVDVIPIQAQCQVLRGSSFAVQIFSTSWYFFVPGVSRGSFCDYIYQTCWLACSYRLRIYAGRMMVMVTLL